MNNNATKNFSDDESAESVSPASADSPISGFNFSERLANCGLTLEQAKALTDFAVERMTEAATERMTDLAAEKMLKRNEEVANKLPRAQPKLYPFAQLQEQLLNNEDQLYIICRDLQIDRNAMPALIEAFGRDMRAYGSAGPHSTSGYRKHLVNWIKRQRLNEETKHEIITQKLKNETYGPDIRFANDRNYRPNSNAKNIDFSRQPGADERPDRPTLDRA